MEACHERGITPNSTLFFCGGIIPEGDIPALEELGFRAVFGPGANTHDIVQFLREHVGAPV